MDVALCYEKVVPSRGGAETYIADLAQRLVADGHSVHLYSCAWDEAALPRQVIFHRLPAASGARWLRPWRFGRACVKAMRGSGHDLSVGFNKTWGQDVLYPQGGLHAASADHNLLKYHTMAGRGVGAALRRLDLAHWSYSLLERRQYLADRRSVVVANSEMVRSHFTQYYGIEPERIRVVRSAIALGRFVEQDRARRRLEWRQRWGIGSDETVGLFIAMNYRLKGLEPLLGALARVPAERPFRLVVVGHPKTAPFERLAKRYGVSNRVHFAGFCSDTRNCYFASDFLVHPTFYDPCSLVVLEAIACGLPVITSRFNGAAELLSPPHDSYVIDDPHDEAHLAWCLGQLADPARRVACTQAVRRTAAQWTFEQHYRRLLEVFAEAAAVRRAA